MDDARALAGRLRERARYDTAVDPLKLLVEAADFLDHLAAPEGVGLTRYAFDSTTFMGHASAVMGEHPAGEWVRHEDAAAALAAEKARADEAGQRIVRHRQSAMERQRGVEAERDALKAALAEIEDSRLITGHEARTIAAAALSKTQGGG